MSPNSEKTRLETRLRYEAFLEKDLHHLNGALAKVFAFADRDDAMT